MTDRKLEYWVIPPEADAEFVAGMEEVLDTYAAPYDSTHPVLCMDEQPVQLLKETRTPMPATKDHPRRVDYEYERAGTASVFLFCEPLAGWRGVSIRERRTKVDWALETAELLRTRYAEAEKVILVCDNLNTHTKGAFYEAFPPAEARAIVRRLEFRHTPKHGSWLNVAENELSAMTRQCMRGRRFGTIEQLRIETAAWQQRTNDKQRGVDWQFRIDDARTRLKSLYPKLPV
jgi:DDE superfamily endonuclease